MREEGRAEKKKEANKSFGKVCCQPRGTQDCNYPREGHSQQPKDGPDQGGYSRAGISNFKPSLKQGEENQRIRNSRGLLLEPWIHGDTWAR